MSVFANKSVSEVKIDDVFVAGGWSFIITAIERWEKSTTFYGEFSNRFNCELTVPNDQIVTINSK